MEKKQKRSRYSCYYFCIIIVLDILSVIIFLITIKPILLSTGTSSETLKLALDYAYILLIFSPFLMFNKVANEILNAKKAMLAIAIGSFLNMVLDPIFIYNTFKLGIKGAAIATVVSFSISTLFIVYWMFIKRNTYLKITFKDFKYDSKI
ncbi:hypothetical protein BW47_03970 [Thermosipho melanesiensis]|uniref:Polysaccharide biosynthesis protein C-terminal domain-containing protein n=1 Tax=Thermosipho melanesiensis TaxID=46541 RepID=A0ABN4UXH8_9BACT|nr:hypothetical protein BW47_03970 [Thermosipho melanesiensis]